MVSEKYILSRATKVDRFYDLIFILKPVLMLCIYITGRNPLNITSGFLFMEDYIGFLFSSS